MKIMKMVQIGCGLGLAMLLCAGTFAVAQAAEQQPPQGMPQGGVGFGMMTVDTSSLTAEQKQAYEAARAIYEQTEDSLLQELIAAGVVTAEDVQTYQTARIERAQFQGLEPPPQGEAPQFDPQQEGQPPQGGQGDQFVRGGMMNVWANVAAATDNAAAQAAIKSLQTAGEAYQKALADAGISMPQDNRMAQPNGQ